MTRTPRSLFGRLAAVFVIVGVISSCTPGRKAAIIPEDYESWPQTTDEVLNFTIPGHGVGLRKIFINALGLEYQQREEGGRVLTEFPQGTLIVKEVYAEPNPAPGTEPAMLTAMYKDSSDPMQRGGWVWIVKNFPSGDETVLNEEFCFTCHNNANESFPYGAGNPTRAFQDFVFYLPAPHSGN